jgi:hypothetical protein
LGNLHRAEPVAQEKVMTGRELVEAWDEITHDRLLHSRDCEPTCAACRLVALIDAALARYEEPGQVCNSGHINILPVKLWDCPLCVEVLKSERDALRSQFGQGMNRVDVLRRATEVGDA